MAQEQLHLTLKCILFGLPHIIMIKKNILSTFKNWDIVYKNSDLLEKSEDTVTVGPGSHMGMSGWSWSGGPLLKGYMLPSLVQRPSVSAGSFR